MVILTVNYYLVLKSDFSFYFWGMQVGDFIQYLSSEKHYSAHTVKAYQNDLIQFFEFLESTYSISDTSKVNSQIIRSWLAALIQQGVSARSASRKLSSLKNFFRYQVKRGNISDNPMLKVVSPKVPIKLPQFIDQSKISKLLDEVKFGNDFQGLRNKLVLELLYATGMRVSELCNLRTRDLDKGRLMVTISGKRNKQRLVPLSNHLFKQIEEYQDLKAKSFSENSTNDYLIVTNKGHKSYPKFIYNIVHKSLALVTTQTKKSPHVLRHSFATAMLDNGADLNAIKELLGHSSLAATQVYTHNTIDRIKRIYEQAHPKA